MEIRTSDRFCILTPLSPKLDLRETARIVDEIKYHADNKIGINLEYVQDCTIDFIECMEKLNISMFNIQSDVFALLNFMKSDKMINIFVSESDFISNKRQILNRNFALI